MHLMSIGMETGSSGATVSTTNLTQPDFRAVAHLGGNVGRYDAEQKLFLLLLLTLQLYPRLNAGARSDERVVVCGFGHVSVIQPGASCTQQEQRLGASLQHKTICSQSLFSSEGGKQAGSDIRMEETVQQAVS